MYMLSFWPLVILFVLVHFYRRLDQFQDWQYDGFEQLITNPEKNTLLKSFLSVHAHLDIPHMFSNIGALLCIQSLLFYVYHTKDLFLSKHSVVLFYIITLIKHTIVETFPQEYHRIGYNCVIGASGPIAGMYGYFITYVMVGIYKNKALCMTWYELIACIGILYLLYNVDQKWYKESSDQTSDEYKDSISDYIHYVGMVSGILFAIVCIILSFVVNYCFRL